MNPPAADKPTWPRPYWTPSDEKAVLLFFIFGRFHEELHIPAARYGSGGLPEGVEMYRSSRQELERWEGYPLRGALGEVLREDHPGIFNDAEQVPEVLTVRGQLADSGSLDYIYDTLGVICALMDIGGVAVVDPQILSLFDREGWQNRFAIEGGAPARNHVLILCNDDDHTEGAAWVRTRGMRKFARPDISIRGVPSAQTDAAGELCLRLVEMQVMGAHFADGQALEIEGLPGTMHAKCGGSLEDPQFNNTHVQFDWPG